MRELLRTNDPVLLTLVQSVLGEAGVGHFIADANMSVLEGSLGILPRRVLVPDENLGDARRLMLEAGVPEGELLPLDPGR
jgi:hypothetical protein